MPETNILKDATKNVQPVREINLDAMDNLNKRAGIGGIGGSAKHGADLEAEINAAVNAHMLNPNLGKNFGVGGIGGSAKHAADLNAELRQ